MHSFQSTLGLPFQFRRFQCCCCKHFDHFKSSSLVNLSLFVLSLLLGMSLILTQEERVKTYGIECHGPSGDGILFKASTWRPGGEYIQKLVVKNVSSKVQKIKYKLPSTRYFSLLYPEEIILSPGIHKEIDVIFRPVEYEPYDDTIFIKILDGVAGHGFHVPVRATIDKLILSAPASLDLGFCTTHQITTIKFDLVNDGEVDAPFSWDSPAPFRLEPASGIIHVGCKEEITVTIMPEDASVYASVAVCHVGTGVHAIIPEPIVRTKLSAKAKYAHLSISEGEVNFNEVVSGISAAPKHLKLRNTSVVPAEFTLIRFDTDRDEIFGVYPKSGIVPPLSEIDVTVTYTALAMGCYSLDRYSFRTPGGCNSVLACKATAMPPKITLCKEVAAKVSKFGEVNSDEGTMIINGTKFREAAPEFSLNFRDVEVGKVETRLFYLRNDSIRDTPFSIIADELGTFQMFPKQGIIPALYKQYPVKVIFTPPKPINYYRRFFVLVGDSMPLFYDCLGTGYIRARGEIREQRPAPLRHAHVQAYRNRSVQGMGGLSPDELDRIYDESEPSPYFAQVGKIGTRALSVAATQRASTRTGESVRTAVAPAHEFFISDTDVSSREITLNRATLDFGFTSHGRVSAAKTITITNSTHSKVVVEWQVPIAGGLSAKDKEMSLTASKDRDVISADRAEREHAELQSFAVSPLNADINPGQSCSFEVTFVPKQTNRNYTSELEAFVFFKNQRTFRLVNDYSLTPPFCVTVTNIGHTFPTGQLLAKAQLLGGCIKAGKLVFPCVFVGEITYQTFMLRNTSNLPCTYTIELGWDGQDKGDEIFSVKPAIGEIAAEDFTLVCVRFAPTATRKYIQLLRLFVNGDEGGKLLLEGAGAVPYLTLPDLQTTTSSGSIVEGEVLDGQVLEQIQQQERVLGVANRAPVSIPKGPMGTFYLKPTCIGLSNVRPFQLKNASRLPLRYRVSLSGAASNIAMVTPKTGVMMGNEVTTLNISFAPRKAELYEFTLTISVYPIGGRTQPVKDANQPGPEAAPELLQTMTVRILAQGETSAMVFEPSRSTAAVRLVNTFEERPIFLDNFSDSDLSYQLMYKEEFEPDAASLDAARTISEVMPLEHHVPFGSIDAHSQTGVKKFEHSLFCERPNGVLPARSRTRVLFTYQPRKSGLFEFLIYAQIQAVDRTTLQPVMISNDEAALLRMSQEDREHGDDQGDGYSGGYNPAMASTVAMLPLMSNITARAAFPKLLFEDIRAESDLQISDVDALWKRFSLSSLNYDLSIPMTHREVSLNESSSPNLTELLTYRFEFMPAVQNSPVQTLTLQLRNNGYLTTEFHAHLPNEKKLELEAWCDEEQPSEELNRIICIIEELKLFTFTPSHAVLQPGETCTLTVSYRHSSLKYDGLHNLPVHIQLSQGKQFYIDLIGRTLPPPHPVATANRGKPNTSTSHYSLHSAASAPGTQGSAATAANTRQGGVPASIAHIPDFLLVVNADQGSLIRLSPVPMGLSAALAPLQRIELINVSGVNISYDVESLSIEQLIEENFHAQVVRIVNPSGFIAAMSSVWLEIHFFPLENKIYDFPLRIKYTAAFGGPGMEKNYSIGEIGNSAASSVVVAPNRKGVAASRGNMRSAGTAPGSTAATSPSVPQFLNLQIQAPAYDPRDAKPVLLESLYPGGIPPVQPLLTLPAQKLTLSEDFLDFKIVPQLCTAKRITMLHNTSATAAFEFVIDESSCILCVDGLLSVRPLFGKIEPQESVVLEFTFAAYAQSMAFNERIKIMVREVIKGAANKKSGMREALMKKIANKKTVTVEHDSVVARPTYARTVQIDHLPAHHGMHATLPSTINAKGAVVSNVVHPAFKHAREDQNLGLTGTTGPELGSFLAGDLNEMSSPSVRSRQQQNRVMEIDVPGHTNHPSPTRSRSGGNVGFAAAGGGNDGRGLSGRSQSLSAGGDLKSGSRGDVSMTSDSKRSGNTASQATLLGAPSVLIIRLRGDVYPIETTRSVIERNKELDIMTEFVVPQSQAFVPPVGKKFFDPAYIESQRVLHSRGKVNISLIKGRDAELRSISEIVADTLFKSLLTTSSVKDYCRSTLSGVNQHAVDVPHSSYGLTSLPANALPDAADSTQAIAAATKKLSDNISYGVYFREILPLPPLVERLVTELKHAGVLAALEEINPFTGDQMLQTLPGALQMVDDTTGEYITAPAAAAEAAAPAPAEVIVPTQWTAAGDAVLAAKAEDVSFNFKHTGRVLAALGITSSSADADCRAAFDDILQCADENSTVSNRNAELATAALLSGTATGATGPYTYSSMATGLTEGSVSSASTTTSSVMVSRAQSRMMNMGREINLAVLIKQLPPKALAYLEMCATRMADRRRRRNTSAEGAATAENGAFSAAADVQSADVAGGSVLDARSVVSDIGAQGEETAQEPGNGTDSGPANVPLVDVYSLLRQKSAGFADLASEILSSMMVDIMQDVLVENKA